ncbi:hypothetical protein KAW64_12175, partial [bacterium]|nr:hypothetical protein [bacterium]
MRVVHFLVAGVVALTMSQVATAAESWISFDGLASEAASVSVVESDMNRLVLSISVPGVFVEEVTTSGGTFARITLDGSGPTVVVGEALLPVVR